MRYVLILRSQLHRWAHRKCRWHQEMHEYQWHRKPTFYIERWLNCPHSRHFIAANSGYPQQTTVARTIISMFYLLCAHTEGTFKMQSDPLCAFNCLYVFVLTANNNTHTKHSYCINIISPRFASFAHYKHVLRSRRKQTSIVWVCSISPFVCVLIQIKRFCRLRFNKRNLDAREGSSCIAHTFALQLIHASHIGHT